MVSNHPASDSSGEVTRNLQALSDEEAKLAQEAESLAKEKQAVLDGARKKAQQVLEKAREKAESEREKILAAEQQKIDSEKENILRQADKDAAALRKRRLNLTAKLLPLIFP